MEQWLARQDDRASARRSVVFLASPSFAADPCSCPDTGVHYRSYFPSTPSGASSHAAELPHDSTLDLLTAYFALADAPLSQMYADWGDKDPKFRKIMESGQGEKVAGLRVCKQDEWETLVACVSFLDARTRQLFSSPTLAQVHLLVQQQHPSDHPDALSTLPPLRHSSPQPSRRLHAAFPHRFPLRTDRLFADLRVPRTRGLDR